jgi:hypothetical protein
MTAVVVAFSKIDTIVKFLKRAISKKCLNILGNEVNKCIYHSGLVDSTE